MKQYYLSNHLGNTLAIISDKRFAGTTKNGVITSYVPDVLSATDYSSFGVSLLGRQINASNVEYGFNGKWNEIETGYQNYGMRDYDARARRFTKVDPLSKSYPELTPYQFSNNSPIENIDIDGLENSSYLDEIKHQNAMSIQRSDFLHKTPITKGLNQIQVYQLAVIKILAHGNIAMPENRRPDAMYLSTLEKVNYSFSHLATSTMVDTKENRDLSMTINNKLIEGLFSGNDELAKASIQEIDRRNTFWGKINIGKEVGLTLGNPISDVINGAFSALRLSFDKAISETITSLSVENKLNDYLLEMTHPDGGSKAKWFLTRLNYTKENMGGLLKQIKFDPTKAEEAGITQFGKKYNQIIRLTGENGKIGDMKFTWIKNNDGYIRLVTGVPVKP